MIAGQMCITTTAVAMSDVGDMDGVWIGPRRVPVWPKDLKIFKFDKDVFFTIYSDLVELQQPLIDATVTHIATLAWAPSA